MTKSQFLKAVMETLKIDNNGYISAVLSVCEELQIEIEDVPQYLTQNLKDKIDAERNNTIENIIPLF